MSKINYCTKGIVGIEDTANSKNNILLLSTKYANIRIMISYSGYEFSKPKDIKRLFTEETAGLQFTL